MVQLPGCRCRCGHEWLARGSEERPRVCPKCKSPNWDTPYERPSIRLIVREFQPDNATHDLALKVPRARSEEDMQALLAQTTDFYRRYPMNPHVLGMVLTPEQSARIVVQASLDSLKDADQRSRWQRALDATP